MHKLVPFLGLPLVLALSGCLPLERAHACRALAQAIGQTFGEERPLGTDKDVQRFVTELESLEKQIGAWVSESIWQGSELTVFEVELGVLSRTLKEFPNSTPTVEGQFGRRIGESVRRLKQSAERLRTFCAAP